MGILAHQDGGGGGDQRRIGRRYVGREIDDALAQHQTRQERKALRVGFGVGKAHQAHVGRPQQALDGPGLRREHQKARVGLSLGEHVDVVGQLAIDQRRRLGRDAVGGQQPQGEAAGAAAGRADQDALALEVGQALEPGAAGIEHPQRLVGDPADRQQSGSVLAGGEAALHEARVHAGGGIGERLEVGERAAGLAHLEVDAVALEDAL